MTHLKALLCRVHLGESNKRKITERFPLVTGIEKTACQ